jgi:4-hydroxy-tetrahydrodipicolinate synthase
LLEPGVHSVLATPFLADESVDEESLRSLVDYYAAAGVVGVLVLGVLGEADKLTDRERERVQAIAIDQASGRVAVTVGVTHGSTLGTRERARAAERAGATAVMVSPPPGSSAGRPLHDHFRRVGDGLSVPLVVQDHPASSGVRLPVEFLAGLTGSVPRGSVVKLEEPPTAPKTAALRRAVPELPVYGGLGGASILHELDAGAVGTMTGFAFPHLLVEIVEAHAGGDRERARRVFESALPLLVFEAQPVVGLGLRKEILRRRGAIASATVRQPAPPLDEQTLAALDELLELAEA